MKNILIVAVTFFTAASCSAQKVQEKDLPAEVKNNFHKAYASVKEVKWDKEKNDYEASFDLNGVDHSVLYDAKGQVLETEIEIKTSELPSRATEYLATNYKGKKISEAAKITDAKGVVSYEAEIKGMDILFDAQGTFIKVVKD